jgi:hypothetical protein
MRVRIIKKTLVGNVARNAAICERRKGGASLASIGREFSLGPERIRQIVELDLQRRAEAERAEVDLKRFREGAPLDVVPISVLDLSARSENALANGNNVKTLADLTSLRETDLWRTPNLGRKSVTEIKDTLASFDLSLAPGDDPLELTLLRGDKAA